MSRPRAYLLRTMMIGFGAPHIGSLFQHSVPFLSRRCFLVGHPFACQIFFDTMIINI